MFEKTVARGNRMNDELKRHLLLDIGLPVQFQCRSIFKPVHESVIRNHVSAVVYPEHVDTVIEAINDVDWRHKYGR